MSQDMQLSANAPSQATKHAVLKFAKRHESIAPMASDLSGGPLVSVPSTSWNEYGQGDRDDRVTATHQVLSIAELTLAILEALHPPLHLRLASETCWHFHSTILADHSLQARLASDVKIPLHIRIRNEERGVPANYQVSQFLKHIFVSANWYGFNHAKRYLHTVNPWEHIWNPLLEDIREVEGKFSTIAQITATRQHIQTLAPLFRGRQLCQPKVTVLRVCTVWETPDMQLSQAMEAVRGTWRNSDGVKIEELLDKIDRGLGLITTLPKAMKCEAAMQVVFHGPVVSVLMTTDYQYYRKMQESSRMWLRWELGEINWLAARNGG